MKKKSVKKKFKSAKSKSGSLKKNGKNKIILIWFIILISILVFNFVFSEKKIENKPPSPAPTKTLSPKYKIIDLNKDTKKYVNEEFSFEFPSSWKVGSVVPNGINLETSDLVRDIKGPAGPFYIRSGAMINIYGMETAYSSLEEIVNVQSQNSANVLNYLTVAGLNAIEFTHHCCEEKTNHLVILFKSGNRVYTLQEQYSLNSQNPYPYVLDEISQTFKLLD